MDVADEQKSRVHAANGNYRIEPIGDPHDK